MKNLQEIKNKYNSNMNWFFFSIKSTDTSGVCIAEYKHYCSDKPLPFTFFLHKKWQVWS